MVARSTSASAAAVLSMTADEKGIYASHLHSTHSIALTQGATMNKVLVKLRVLGHNWLRDQSLSTSEETIKNHSITMISS